MLAQRFVTAYRSAGYDRPALAKLLHVSERTLHNWESGVHDIPYSSFRLVRILSRFEFPDPAWRGWHMMAGKLWSPEGYSFTPSDSSWWSLLCARAQSASVLMRQVQRLNAQVAALQADLQAARQPRLLHTGEASAGHVDAAVCGGACATRTDSAAGSASSEVLVTPHFSLTGEKNDGSVATPASPPAADQAGFRWSWPAVKWGLS